jgi:hypothetical protein
MDFTLQVCFQGHQLFLKLKQDIALIVVHRLGISLQWHLWRRPGQFLPQIVNHDPEVDVDDGQGDGEDQRHDGNSTSNS